MLAHLRRGDLVMVTVGKDKGKRGKVLRLVSGERVVVEHCAVVKRHTKPTQNHPQGGIIEKEASIAISNVRLICPECDAPRRFKTAVDAEHGKGRVCAKCSTKLQAIG